MPTAAKLFGGIGFGLTALLAAYYFAAAQNDYRIAEVFVLTNFPVGFLVGWFSIGQNPGTGNVKAIANGFRSSIFLLIFSSLVFSMISILFNLRQHKFEDPVDLPLRWIELSFSNAILALSVEVITVLVIGGCLSGFMTFQISRRWS